MFRLLTLLLLFVISLHALSDNEILKRANGFMRDGSKSNYFRAYNDYKNLYLRAIISENSNLKYRSLQGIVKSGKKLHIDISQYSNELSTIKPKTSYKAIISTFFCLSCNFSKKSCQKWSEKKT